MRKSDWGAVIIVALYMSLFLFPLCADAEESPCRADGSTVVCTRPGFDALVAKTLEARQAAAKCVLEAESRTADQKVLEARLALVTSERELALARVRELEMKPFPRGRMFAAIGLGVGAGVAGALAPVVSSDAASIGLAGVALVSAASAAVLVLLE